MVSQRVARFGSRMVWSVWSKSHFTMVKGQPQPQLAALSSSKQLQTVLFASFCITKGHK